MRLRGLATHLKFAKYIISIACAAEKSAVDYTTRSTSIWFVPADSCAQLHKTLRTLTYQMRLYSQCSGIALQTKNSICLKWHIPLTMQDSTDKWIPDPWLAFPENVHKGSNFKNATSRNLLALRYSLSMIFVLPLPRAGMFTSVCKESWSISVGLRNRISIECYWLSVSMQYKKRHLICCPLAVLRVEESVLSFVQ